MEKYETKKLYVVRPSIVISDKSIRIGYDKKKDEVKYKHIAKFQNNSKDTNIVTSTKHNFVYKSLFSDTCYFEGMGHHCLEGDYHVGINKDDIMLLAKYFYIQRVSNPEWNRELEEYIISLKPYYDYDELCEIYKQIKDKDDEEVVKTKTLTNEYIV